MHTCIYIYIYTCIYIYIYKNKQTPEAARLAGEGQPGERLGGIARVRLLLAFQQRTVWFKQSQNNSMICQRHGLNAVCFK